MKRKILTIVVGLLCCGGAFVQAKAAPTLHSQEQSEKPTATAQQSAELAEASRLSEQVIKLYRERKYDEALPLAKRALAIREKALPPNDEKIGSALYNLAFLRLAMKDHADAESVFRRLLAFYEKSEADNLKSVTALEQLALLRYANGDFRKTEDYYQRALTIKEKRLGENHLDVAESVFKLAEFYNFTGSLTKAAPLYQRALAVREKSLGPADPKITTVLERSACLLRKSNKLEEAERLEARIVYNPSLLLPKLPADGERLGQPSMMESGVINGKALSIPKPSYPPEARAARVEGTVIVRVTIDETGKVINACALSGHSLLWQASEGAAYRARFTPTQLDGAAVKVTGTISYNFVR